MSEWGCGGIFCPILHISPSGGSTLITSAPKSDKIVAALGPAMKLAKSTTFNPENIFSPAISSPSIYGSDRRSRRVASNFSTVLPRVPLPTLELRCTFLEECRSSFFLVVGGGADCEKRGFDEQAFGYARLQPFVDRLQRVLHAQRSVRNDLLQRSFGTLDQGGRRYQFVYQADAISFRRVDDVA